MPTSDASAVRNEYNTVAYAECWSSDSWFEELVEAEHTELSLWILDERVERIPGVSIENDAGLLGPKHLRKDDVLPHLTDSPEVAIRHSCELVLRARRA